MNIFKKVANRIGSRNPVNTKISPFEAWDIIRQQKGKIFTVEFYKKSGELRVMNCRLGVKKDLKGGENKVAKKYSKYRTVFDCQKQSYRMINLETLLTLKAGGNKYQIETLQKNTA